MSVEFHNLFPQGGPNTVAGQYFSGDSYLCPLSDMGGPMSILWTKKVEILC